MPVYFSPETDCIGNLQDSFLEATMTVTFDLEIIDNPHITLIDKCLAGFRRDFAAIIIAKHYRTIIF
ncbi:MAG TPA: hypothetical protein DCS48_11915 [Desulfovibrio sp.]|nr:hypothetical protein [Desulfovibrio sp.]